MTFYFVETFNIFALILFSILLAFLIIILSYLFSSSNPDSEKLSAYECGFDPYEDARNSFDVRFYLVAILFIVFDLEAVYFYPWCVSISFLNNHAFWGMLDFIIELLFGFIYAWEVGALDWD
jgi:NADH-quinone oxidoreductase subunit A